MGSSAKLTGMSETPLLLFAWGEPDPNFRYACRFSVEQGLYLRLAPDDDLLVVSALELDRARAQARAVQILDRAELGWREQRDMLAAWAELAPRILRERGAGGVRVSPVLPAAMYQALRASDIEVEIDHLLFVEERRRKSDDELACIRVAQSAAEAACIEVIRWLAAADAEHDQLMLEGRPLTSEWLMARAQLALNERGCGAAEMIVAGAPDSAVPHLRGSGPIRPGAPVVIDIFPRHQASGYYGDLTRTVVPGVASPEIHAMHEGCVEALDTALRQLRAGADGRAAHRAACQVLVERGFGTLTPGLEGPTDAPRMIHSTGHGVGLEVHEPPYLRDLDYPLLAGDVVTVEPGLYYPGLGGVRVEDLVLVGDKGPENLTSLPRSIDPAAYL